VYLTPPLREFPLDFCNGGSVQKLGACPYQRWKEFDDVCIRLDTIPECDSQTERQTDGLAITISRSAWMLTRDKNLLYGMLGSWTVLFPETLP